MFKTRSLLLFNQIFEYADILCLLNFDSEHLLQVVTENKAVEREKLDGIEKWNGLSHFQRCIRCGSKKISATYQLRQAGSLLKALVVIKSGKRMETDDERMMKTKDNVSSN